MIGSSGGWGPTPAETVIFFFIGVGGAPPLGVGNARAACSWIRSEGFKSVERYEPCGPSWFMKDDIV